MSAKPPSRISNPESRLPNPQLLPYLVMELVEGKTLDALIPRAGLRLSEVLKIGKQIAQALVAAHATGVVHRDLKPANVMVGPGGAVKVLDFGLARLSEPAPASGASQLPTGEARTGAGVVLGTPAYMSPEQVEGRPVDARAASSPVKLIASTAYDAAPDYAPDGLRIAFSSDRSGSYEIWVCNRDGSNATQVTKLAAMVTGSPRWSPDGRSIAFDSDVEGQTEIYIVAADGARLGA